MAFDMEALPDERILIVMQNVIFSPPVPAGPDLIYDPSEKTWDVLSLREFADLTTLRSLYMIPTHEEDWVLSISEAFAGTTAFFFLQYPPVLSVIAKNPPDLYGMLKAISL